MYNFVILIKQNTKESQFLRSIQNSSAHDQTIFTFN